MRDHSQIVNKYQVRDAVLRDFQEDNHYQYINDELRINHACFLILLINFRSKLGLTEDGRYWVKQLFYDLALCEDAWLEFLSYGSPDIEMNWRNCK